MKDHLIFEATLNHFAFDQAVLSIPHGYDRWFKDRSRRNVRKSVRKALDLGMTVKEIPLEQTYNSYLKIEKDRGAPSSWPFLPLLKGSPRLSDHLTVGIWNSENDLVALVYGVQAGAVIKIFLAVGSTRNDGARWLCFAEFIRCATQRGISTVIVETRRDLSPGLLHFQNMFGFQSRNILWLRNK